MAKRAMVINDLSSFGRCSLTAYIAVLSAMGHTPCPLPTAVLSAQSEFPDYFGMELTDAIPEYKKAWQKNRERFDGISTGYFANSRQLDHAADIINSFRTEGSAVLVDPVMGDNGSLYPDYDKACCAKMKRLISAADVITPNLTELCLLTDTAYADLTAHSAAHGYFDEITALARQIMRPLGVIVTGIRSGGDVCNLAVTGDEARIFRCKNAGESFSGTGDIFSAVIFGCILSGKTLFEAARLATDFVERSIADTVEEPHDPLYGVNFEKFLTILAEVK